MGGTRCVDSPGKIMAASIASAAITTNTSTSVKAWILRFERRGFMMRNRTFLFMAVAGERDRVNDKTDDKQSGNNADDEEDVVDLVGLFGKFLVGVETRRASTA